MGLIEFAETIKESIDIGIYDFEKDSNINVGRDQISYRTSNSNYKSYIQVGKLIADFRAKINLLINEECTDDESISRTILDIQMLLNRYTDTICNKDTKEFIESINDEINSVYLIYTYSFNEELEKQKKEIDKQKLSVSVLLQLYREVLGAEQNNKSLFNNFPPELKKSEKNISITQYQKKEKRY